MSSTEICDYVPKECFIDRRQFASDRDLYEKIRAMEKEEYETYLLAIENFLKSPEAHLFSIEHFIGQVLAEIENLEKLYQ